MRGGLALSKLSLPFDVQKLNSFCRPLQNTFDTSLFPIFYAAGLVLASRGSRIPDAAILDDPPRIFL